MLALHGLQRNRRLEDSSMVPAFRQRLASIKWRLSAWCMVWRLMRPGKLSAQKTDVTGSMSVGRDWVKAVAFSAVCVFLVIVSAYGVQMEPTGVVDMRFHSGSFIILPVFSVMTLFSLYRLAVPWGPPVRISTEGIVDLRAGSRIIPWDQISNVVARGELIQLTLRRNFAKEYPYSLTQRILKATRRSAGPGHLLIAPWFLATTTEQLIKNIKAHGSH